MAPRFKYLTYQISPTEDGARAMVGFSLDTMDQLEAFRDALRNKIEGVTGFKHITTFGVYPEIDQYIRFFDVSDADRAIPFYSKPSPSCISALLRTKNYRRYVKEEETLEPLVKVLLITSHDFPCVVVDRSVLTESLISEVILQVAEELRLTLIRGQFKYSIDSIVTSNWTFDATSDDE